MTVNRKVTGKSLSMPAGLAIGLGVSMGLTLLLSVILAKLVSNEQVPWEQVGYGIMLLLFCSAMTGTAISCGVIKRRKLVICAAQSGLFWVSLLALTALFFGGQYSGVGTTAIIISGGNFAVYLLSLRGGGRKKNAVHRGRR